MESLNGKYSDLYGYEMQLNDYLSLMYYDGIGESEFHQLSHIFASVKYMRMKLYSEMLKYRQTNGDDSNYYALDALLSQIIDLEKRYESIYDLLKENFMPSTLTDYLRELCSLTHLIYTNNNHPKIRLFTYDSFMFLCQFHIEKTPSLGVTESKNLCHCFGCGYGSDQIYYIRNFENLSRHHALSLLAKIYLVDINSDLYSDSDPLVKKYREVLLSDEFRELLEERHIKTIEGSKTMGALDGILKYDTNVKNIERIRNGEHIKFNNGKNKLKKVYLKPQTRK